MVRPTHVMRPASLHIHINAELRRKMDEFLFSSVEGRVPVGAHKGFIEARLRAFFEHSRLEVEPGLWVQGDAVAITALKAQLQYHQEEVA